MSKNINSQKSGHRSVLMSMIFVHVRDMSPNSLQLTRAYISILYSIHVIKVWVTTNLSLIVIHSNPGLIFTNSFQSFKHYSILQSCLKTTQHLVQLVLESSYLGHFLDFWNSILPVNQFIQHSWKFCNSFHIPGQKLQFIPSIDRSVGPQ